MCTDRARARKGQSRILYIHKYEERNGTAGQKAERNRFFCAISVPWARNYAGGMEFDYGKASLL